jgi:hypothetical protein
VAHPRIEVFHRPSQCSRYATACAYPSASHYQSPRYSIPPWRASLIRNKAQVLGDVQAPNREAAEAVAVRTFNLSPEQRSRLVVQERS